MDCPPRKVRTSRPGPASRGWNSAVSLVLVLLPVAGAALAQSLTDPQIETAERTQEPPATSEPPAPSAVPVELRFTTPPKTKAELDKTLSELDAELAALAPTTQPATSQPTTQPEAAIDEQLDGWRVRLWQHLNELRTQIVELDGQRKALEVLSSDREVRTLADQIAAWKKKTDALTSAPIPAFIPDARIAELETAYNEQNQALNAISAAVEQQEGLLREGFAAQRAKLADDLKAALSQREQFEGTYEVDIKAAESEAARQLVEMRRRSTSATAAALETMRAVIDIKEKRTTRELEQNRLRRDALKPYVVALREHVNALIEEKSRGRAERLRELIQSPDLPETDRLFYELELIREESVARLQKEYANQIKDRFQESVLAAYRSGMQRDRVFWEEFSESLPRRTADDVRDAYRDATTELDAALAERQRLQRLLDQSVVEERAIEELSRAALERFKLLEERFRAVTEARAAEESVVKKLQEIGDIRQILGAAFEGILRDERAVIDRLRDGLAISEDQVALWDAAVSRLYWSHLVTRGPSAFSPDGFTVVGAELNHIVGGGLQTSLREAWNAFRGRASLVTGFDAIMGIAAVAMLGYLLYRIRRRCLAVCRQGYEAYFDRTRNQESALRFVDRLRYHLARVGAGCLPLLAVPAALAVGMVAVNLTDVTLRLGYLLIGLIAAPTVAAGAVNAALTAPKPRYRLIPCSHAVARYYRRFGHAFIVISTLLLGAARLLMSLDIGPAAARFLTEGFVFLANILVFVFLLRRETVLNIFPRTDRGRFSRTLAALRGAYPLIVLVAAGLVVMHLAGYVALALYVTVSVSTTIGLVLVAWLVHELVRELAVSAVRAARRRRRAAGDSNPRENADAAAPPPSMETQTPPAPALETAPEVPPEDEPSVRAALSASRWILTIAVLIAALSAWGVRPFEIKQLLDWELWRQGDQSVTLWRIGGAVIAVVAAVIVSRTIRQTLRTRFYPAHPAIDRGAQAAINSLLHYLIVGVGVYVGLRTLLLDFGALTVLFGGLGLGLGLGLQPLIVNFISGLFMLFERHVKVGDVVIVHDKLGEVTRVSMRSTTIRTPDGICLVIPNGEFINEKVENWTLEASPLRGLVEIGVSYSCDPRQVRELLLKIAGEEPRVLRDPPPDVFFLDFGDNSLKFSLVCWFRDPGDRWFGMISLRYTIFEKFREAGIEIPFPQRTLSLIGDKPLEVRLSNGP